MELEKKLAILADAAKYDASCASSGTVKRNSRGGTGLGSASSSGICHSYTPDGRCVSLLKILLTNYCIYDCLYCVNRVSSTVSRARFTPDEVIRLTLDFYRRNYIEGLFLSSGIIRDPDYTMEQVVKIARSLRVEHQFRGYIHLKTIPEASCALIDEAGRWADRISINIELPTQDALNQLAPEKNIHRIQKSMASIRAKIDESKAERRASPKAPTFAPAGQSTQMIIGATPSSDAEILDQAAILYRSHNLRRVYYSAFSPIPNASTKLPLVAPPLLREHRLYQADWLMRFYGFRADELTAVGRPNLDLRIDPKLSWALRHLTIFPVNINTAERSVLLRVPGLGVRSVRQILRVRRWRRLRLEDLVRLKVPLKKILPFIEVVDHRPRDLGSDADTLMKRLRLPDTQLELFNSDSSIINGEL